ncbi:hypothetical protein ACFL2T_02620 [Elusimicrobiota bacterium]
MEEERLRFSDRSIASFLVALIIMMPMGLGLIYALPAWLIEEQDNLELKLGLLLGLLFLVGIGIVWSAVYMMFNSTVVTLDLISRVWRVKSGYPFFSKTKSGSFDELTQVSFCGRTVSTDRHTYTTFDVSIEGKDGFSQLLDTDDNVIKARKLAEKAAVALRIKLVDQTAGGTAGAFPTTKLTGGLAVEHDDVDRPLSKMTLGPEVKKPGSVLSNIADKTDHLLIRGPMVQWGDVTGAMIVFAVIGVPLLWLVHFKIIPATPEHERTFWAYLVCYGIAGAPYLGALLCASTVLLGYEELRAYPMKVSLRKGIGPFFWTRTLPFGEIEDIALRVLDASEKTEITVRGDELMLHFGATLKKSEQKWLAYRIKQRLVE